MPSGTAIFHRRLRECPGCGLVQRLKALPRNSVARCVRCDQVLRRQRTDPVGRSLALGLTGLMMFLLASNLDFIALDVRGRTHATTLIAGPVQMEQYGMWEVALVVLLTIFIAPLLRLCCLLWVMAGLQLRQPLPAIHIAFRWAIRLAPWSMIEVFLLGVFVAYTKLVDLAQVHVGTAVYALAGLMLAQVAADSALDRDTVWEVIERRGLAAGVRSHARGPLLSCEACGLVTDTVGRCPRCAARLEARKPASRTRTWALLAASALLYIPANFLPVMTYVRLGNGNPNTILSGVMELASSGMWPLAVLVFFASITVPVLKLGGLAYLLFTTRRGSGRFLRRRTRMYRAIEAIGRWSMIDVFMISILTALVRLDGLASVYPGPGVLAFCSVVILTMIAAITFDPRLMWDEAGRNPRHPPTVGPKVASRSAGLLVAR